MQKISELSADLKENQMRLLNNIDLREANLANLSKDSNIEEIIIKNEIIEDWRTLIANKKELARLKDLKENLKIENPDSYKDLKKKFKNFSILLLCIPIKKRKLECS